MWVRRSTTAPRGRGKSSVCNARCAPLPTSRQSLLTAAAPAQAVEDGGSRAEAAVTAVRLEVLTNHGDPDYTCVYGVGVHGTPIPL